MLLHVVLFNFKPEVDERKVQEIFSACYEKLKPIPGVMSLSAGKTIKPDSEFEYAISMYFENPDVLQEYREHPAHVEFR